MDESARNRSTVAVLSYARPGTVRRGRSGVFKYTCAVLFAASALFLGSGYAVGGVSCLDRAPTRARRLLACGAVLIGPGLWYGFVGLRGLRAGVDLDDQKHDR